MTGIILGMVGAGILAGRYLLPAGVVGALDSISVAALGLLALGVGIDIGRNRDAWRTLRQLGGRIVLVPLSVATGSIGGAILAGIWLHLPANASGAVGAGFGWYSLSGILLSKLATVEIGALAFLTNVFREVIAVGLMPVLARYTGKITAIAPGGATTMDTTLPVIVKYVGAEVAVIAFVSGVLLTLAVPVLVPLIIRL